MNGLLSLGRRLCAALVIILAISGALAEVGVSDMGSMNSLFILGITEDPNPVGIWFRYSPDSATRHVLNEEGVENGDGKPSAVYNHHSKLAIVAWSRNSPDGFDVVVSRFADGAWTDPEVLASSPADELDPFLTLDPSDGSVHLLYCVDGVVPAIFHRSAPADLSTWRAPIRVSQLGEIAVRPAAAFVAGQLHVVYEGHPFGLGTVPREIVWAALEDQAFSGGVLATTQHAAPNWPEIHFAPGRAWIEWIDDEGEMVWIRRDVPGIWEPLQIEPFDTIEKRDYHVRGAIKARALD